MFDFHRYIKVVWRDCRQMIYLSRWPMMLIMAVFVLLWLLSVVAGNAPSITHRCQWLLTLLDLVIILAPSLVYGVVNQGNKGTYFAMLPASKEEKFLSMVTITAVIMPLVMIVLLTVIDSILSFLPSTPKESESHIVFFLFTYGWPSFGVLETTFNHNALRIMICYGAIFFFANTIFQKHKVVRTLLTLFLIAVIVSIIVTVIISMQAESIIGQDGYQVLSRFDWIRNFADWVNNFVKYAFAGAFAIMLYAISYFRLCKMQY